MLSEREVYMITIACPEKYKAGLYERLSNENIEANDGEMIAASKDELESGSISTQKIFLRNFCKENKIKVHDDYTDDGFSGANFDRPDFNRMIQDIEKKRINMVIVKDLSRFGRVSNLISYYLEEYFIEKGVRFIAITDDIDTGSIETSEDMVQFKAFFNEWFLRDTSRKVRNGKKTRAKEGKVMVTYPTYGYKKDPQDKNHYVIDEEIAPIVKRIFEYAREGKTPTQIGNILTKERILVPSEVVGNVHVRKDGIKRGWNRNTVKKILTNVTYLGWVSNGNVKKINYKSKKLITIPKEDRIIVEQMHEPLVDRETFNIVQNLIKSRTSVRVKSYDWLLKGLLTCKECGKKLSIVPQKYPNKTTFYTRCNTYAGNTNLHLCTSHSNNLEKLTDLVIEQIKEKCREFLEEDKDAKLTGAIKSQRLKDKHNLENEIKILRKKAQDINKIIDGLVEDKYKGIFEDEDFTRLYSKQIENRKTLEKQIKALEKQISNNEYTVDINKLLKGFLSANKVTKECIVSLVDKIEVSESKEITIFYKFNILNVKKIDNNFEQVG